MLDSLTTDFQPSQRDAADATCPAISAADLAPLAPARLRSLRSGEVAIVMGLDATRVSAKRLADLGFIPGVRVEMLRSGTPCLVRVNGICLGLGAGHQESILLSATAAE